MTGPKHANGRGAIIAAAAGLFLAGAGAAQDPTFIGLPLDGAPRAVSGPYDVVREDAGPRHTIIRPANLSAFPQRDTLPILVWGNGGCIAQTDVYDGFLETVASHGYLVVTTRQAPDGPGQVTAGDLLAGIDVALDADREGSALHGRVDTGNIALMGQSCGGILALSNAARDPRIDTVAGWNAGIEPGFFRHRRFLVPLRIPVLLIDGGDSDIEPIRRSAQPSFDAIGAAPVFRGALENGGHAGTIGHPGGGAYANIAADWLDWTLKGDAASGETFMGPDCRLCADPLWTVQRKGF